MAGYLQTRFFTRSQKINLPDLPFSLPDESTQDDLNNLVNKLLSDTDDKWHKETFEFLVDGNLLRTSLKEFVQENGLSTENVIEIECIRREVPQPHVDLPHDDWVGAVRATENFIIAGCFDNTLTLWSHEGDKLQTVQAHEGPVKCLTTIPSQTPGITRFASGSHDQTVSVWDFDPVKNVAQCVQVGKGHERSVECICANEDGTRLASGSYDCYLKIWNTVENDGVEEATVSKSERKKIKTESGKSIVKAPMVTLGGHREAVTGVCWTDSAEVITAGFDSSIVVWDLEMAGKKSALNGTKAFTSIAYSPLNKMLISGSTDRHVRLWDPRSKEGSLVKSTFTSHSGWVVAVDWSKTNEYNFISGSYDRLLKMWDTRSHKAPLFDLTGHEDRILCCDWTVPQKILSGGVDNSLKVFRAATSS